MDTVDRKTRSRIMASVKSKGNRSTERRLRSALMRHGISGWRMNVKELPGSPDFVFDAAMVAVFVDGCFWHGCPRCYRRPSTSRAYWDAKVQRNMARDTKKRAMLRRQGWSALRIWEHQLVDLDKVVARIQAKLASKYADQTP